MKSRPNTDHKSESFNALGVSDVRLLELGKKEISFAESLVAVMAERKYNISEVAAKVGQGTRTIGRWRAGDTVPELAVREWVIATLSNPSNSPSAKVCRDMDRLHNLTWDSSKSRWKLRFTVATPQMVKKRFVGNRRCHNLKTADAAIAIEIREGIVEILQKEGFTIQPRFQKRKLTNFP